MLISNNIFMKGEWNDIWRLASRIEDWPVLLPHYREVTVINDKKQKNSKNAHMTVNWGFIPLGWNTEQVLTYSKEPAQSFIRYYHLSGITKGMKVVWTFMPIGNPEEISVTITHDWNPSWPVIGRLAAWFISKFIIHNIADKTLSKVKELALISSSSSSQMTAPHEHPQLKV